MAGYPGTELDALAVARNYYRAILAYFTPYVGRRVVEVGAGIGTFSDFLLKCTKVTELTLIEPSDTLFPVLQHRFSGETRVKIMHSYGEHLSGSVAADSVVLVNVLEHVADDSALLRVAHSALVPGGSLLVFVPAVPCLFGTLDKHFGHCRRYTKALLSQRVLKAGLRLVRLRYFNFPGVVTWFLASRVLKRRALGHLDVWLYDRWMVPLISKLERWQEPPVGQSLIAIALKQETRGGRGETHQLP